MRIFFSILFATFSLLSGEGLKVKNGNFNFTNLTGFPENFIFATATASYQVEGAWNVSGKGENIWDRITHTRPQWVEDGHNGDEACDSYNQYKEDVKNIKSIGFQMYRFSLSWSRLFPTGYTSSTNQDGVRYYSALIDELQANGIEPMVTLYHWDLPQPLEDIGGWLNPKIADTFGEYARAVFKLFGDKVKWWITINEPESVTYGYGGTTKAPALNMHGTGEYISGHNLLRAHAKAYRIYDKEFRSSQKGKLSLALNGGFYYPKNVNDSSHVEAAERANQFTNGWFAHPIYSEKGDYPPVMREYVDRNSKAEGLKESRLPQFTDEEIKEIKGTFDYMGVNHYTSKNAEPGTWGPDPSISRDQNVLVTAIPGALISDCHWLHVTPRGFRDYLNWIKKTYGNQEVFIAESGYCDNGEINDQKRIYYYQEYLKNLLAAIKEDGCKVLGYTVWSLMDNFEWQDGYTKKFGLIKVDFNSQQKYRTNKLSAKFMRELIQKNKVKNDNVMPA